MKKTNSPSKSLRQAKKPIPQKLFETRKKQTEERPALNKLGALWLKRGKTGNIFMSGIITLADDSVIKLLVFKNNYKEESRHPDYQIFEVPDEEPIRSAGVGAITDDDIPF